MGEREIKRAIKKEKKTERNVESHKGVPGKHAFNLGSKLEREGGRAGNYLSSIHSVTPQVSPAAYSHVCYSESSPLFCLSFLFFLTHVCVCVCV